MRILNHTVNFFSIYSFQIVFCSKIASLLLIFKSHIMRTWTMLKMILKFAEERVTLKTKKKKWQRASIYSYLSSYNEEGRGFSFIVYSAKIMLLNTCCREVHKNSHLTLVAWIIFSHVFPLSTRKLTLKMKPSWEPRK